MNHHPLDEEDICANFARQPDSEGYTEAEFRQVLVKLLAQGVVRRVPYRASDGSTRHRIERRYNLRTDAFGAFGGS
jgi:hypothetical protein